MVAASPVLTSTGKELELPDDGSASGWTDGDGDGSSAENLRKIKSIQISGLTREDQI